jgi:hypothetical protein
MLKFAESLTFSKDYLLKFLCESAAITLVFFFSFLNVHQVRLTHRSSTIGADIFSEYLEHRALFQNRSAHFQMHVALKYFG